MIVDIFVSLLVATWCIPLPILPISPKCDISPKWVPISPSLLQQLPGNELNNLVLKSPTFNIWSRVTFATSGDQIQPGDTELTLILNFARSRAMFLVMMLIAPLDAP